VCLPGGCPTTTTTSTTTTTTLGVCTCYFFAGTPGADCPPICAAACASGDDCGFQCDFGGGAGCFPQSATCGPSCP
jgi:hypothetical protein